MISQNFLTFNPLAADAICELNGTAVGGLKVETHLPVRLPNLNVLLKRISYLFLLT